MLSTPSGCAIPFGLVTNRVAACQNTLIPSFCQLFALHGGCKVGSARGAAPRNPFSGGCGAATPHHNHQKECIWGGEASPNPTCKRLCNRHGSRCQPLDNIPFPH